MFWAKTKYFYNDHFKPSLSSNMNTVKNPGPSGKDSVMLSLRNFDRFHKESTHTVT